MSSLRAFVLRIPCRNTALRNGSLREAGQMRAQMSQRYGRFYSTAAESQRAGSGRRIKLSYAIAATTVLCSASYLSGLLAPPELFQVLNPRPAPPPPPADSDEGRKVVEKVERELNNLPLLRKCREAPDADEWYETRPYAMPPERLANHFTGGVLRSPGRIAVPPIVRAKKDETEAWVFIHLGRGVCGHDGIVHGGLLSTLLDEGCGRNAMLAFPSHIGVTANLNLDFKAPTKADQFVVMKTKLIEVNGRKAIIHGQIEDLNGKVLVTAKALFIEPKFASAVNMAGVSAVYPHLQRSVLHMAGPATRAEGGGQVIDAVPDTEEKNKTK
ncbi:HotDog domain-containing protein [Hysterangium stoloniferum]|nr:HotDog domain-containing protein [Hysterangium stoloniferum]